MSYTTNYSTLPIYYNNSRGYLETSVSLNSINPVWFAPIPNDLTPGVYFITSSISYINSPNSYAYIILDNSNNNSIFVDNNLTYYPLNNFSTYQGNNPNVSDAQGNQWNTYTSWWPIAGQQMRDGPANGSNCLSLSAIVTISAATKVTTLAYTQSGGYAYINQYCVRII